MAAISPVAIRVNVFVGFGSHRILNDFLRNNRDKTSECGGGSRGSDSCIVRMSEDPPPRMDGGMELMSLCSSGGEAA